MKHRLALEHHKFVRGTQFRCLELMPLRWKTVQGIEHSEYAVLHEIGTGCGLFQVDEPAAPGSTVFLYLPQGEIAGIVRSCTPEDSGYILDVAIAARQEWLGGRYRPSELIPIALPLAS